MHLIVGLGNPGAQYARTRHNIGWMVVEALASKHGIELSRKSFDARHGTGMLGERRVLIAEPLTYMNLSGKAVSAIARFHNIPHEHILVVTDDLILPLGKLRLRVSGSDGGHNGLKSIAQLLGTKNYPRLRFGIGAPPQEQRAERGTVDYVLGRLASDEMPMVEQAIDNAVNCIESFVQEGAAVAMNKFNG